MNGDRHMAMVPRTRLLPAAHRQPTAHRELLLEAVTRVIHPSVLVVAVYLFLVGMHRPGGGFAAGLVAGLGLVLRRLAGGPWATGAVAPAPPGVLLGAGLATVAGYGVGGVLLAGEFLTSAAWHLHAGPLGDFEVSAHLIFELGIALIVVGLVVDVLRTLGAESRPSAGPGAGGQAPAQPTDRPEGDGDQGEGHTAHEEGEPE